MPDVGATLAALETASGRRAHRVGKPCEFGLQAILADHFLEEQAQWSNADYLSQFCYVGDNIDTDVYFSHNAKIGSVLVLSGLAKATDSDKIQRANPTFVMETFAGEQ